MPIMVPCPSCGKTLRAPDELAGKQARCPACKQLMTVPGPHVTSPLEDMMAEEEAYAPQQPAATVDPEPGDPDNPYRPMTTINVPPRSRREQASEADDKLTTGDWVLCFLCSNIMCIVGIVRLITGNPKGLKTIGACFLAQGVWFLVGMLYGVIKAILNH